ncbi:hypothetical protein FLL45_01405 [Aliikangiella marina]|uniref:Adenine methyltransferase n=1 Tax=Aliikangiella marina TaxID=1712262 RepID=A0A545THE2_9GAMM|nr:DNA N-6-adenine-methyltransferase [Aliikangiella marina]TQV76643.1 hypothetical protein FLL45_01405 [Aliikangiella marina]
MQTKTIRRYGLTKEQRDCWRTPKWMFNWLNSMYDFDVDLAADEENSFCKDFLSTEQDSLSVEWSKYWDVGFLNPPYSAPTPWIKQIIKEQNHGFTTVLVMPTLNGDIYNSPILRRASSITFIIGRIAFLAPADYWVKGKPGKSDRLVKAGTPVSGGARGTAIYEFAPIPLSREGRATLLSVNRNELIKAYS